MKTVDAAAEAGAAVASGPATAVEIEHDLVVVDEFDAFRIEVNKKNTSLGQTLSPEASLYTKYPGKLHAKKVAKELGVTSGLIYLPGQVTQPFEDSDMSYDFRQRRYFFYLAGLNFPDCAVTYDIGKDQLLLWIPYTDPKKVLWFGSTPGIDECKAVSDVDDVRYIHGLSGFLSSASSAGAVTTLYVLHANQTPPDVGGSPPLYPHARPPPTSPKIDSTHLQPAMDAARVIKTPYEIATVRRANDVSSAAHRRVAELLGGGKFTNERDIDAVFRAECTRMGAPTQAYPVIAGSGPNASVLHYMENNQDLEGRQLVVLDAGCEWNCYASDVTRTLPIPARATDGSGAVVATVSAEARAILAAVGRMQDECIAMAKPGTAFRALDSHAHAVAVDELLALGILRGEAKDILAQGTSAAFFPHGLGHHVGLETHDVSGRLRLLAQRVVPGTLATVPGQLGCLPHGAAPAAAAGAAAASIPPPPPPPAADAHSHSRTSSWGSVSSGAAGGSLPATTGSGTGSSSSTAKSRRDSGSGCRRATSSWLFTPPPVGVFRHRRGSSSGSNLGGTGASAAAAPPPPPPPQESARDRYHREQREHSARHTAAAVAAASATAASAAADILASTVAAPVSAKLAPGMIVTVEPGIYFCRPYIDAFFLANPAHARFIDAAVLERYYPVGGVRIEDDVLITDDDKGHENLTSAPKGEELLRIMGLA